MNTKKLGIGVSFRMKHLPEIEQGPIPIDWFELIADQFLVPTKKNLLALDFLKGRFPLALHGVGLAIGSPLPLNFDYLRKIKALAKEVKAPLFSEHLSWGQIPGAHFHELLPLPFRKDVADYVIEKARIVQDFLEIPFALENISSFVEADDKEMEEWDFYSYIVEKSDTYMLLDVNNIYVTARNIGFNPEQYLDSIPHDKVVQIHLAGHLECDNWVIDTHDQQVRNEVWELYKKIWARLDQPATLLEIDDEASFSFEETYKEALKAKQFQNAVTDVSACVIA